MSESMSGNAPPLPVKQPPPPSDEAQLVKPNGSLLDAEYRCFCGTFHVERGAYWIAIVGIVLAVVSLVPSVLINWSSGVSIALSITVYAGILIAQRKQKAGWYLPYLILNGIGLILIPIYIVGCAVLMVYMKEFFDEVVFKYSKPEDYAPYTHEQLIFGARVVFGILIAVLLLSAAMGIWFQSVVWRAYKFMKVGNQLRREIHFA